MMKKPYMIAICGNSGSGKTYIANLIAGRFDSGVKVLNQDNYYKVLEDQPRDENGQPNFDTPESLDLEKFRSDIAELKERKSIELTKYSYNNPRTKSNEKIYVEPDDVILIEGIFVYHTDELHSLFDLSLYVDSDIDTQLKRRIKRDAEERGYGEGDVLYKFEHHIKPAVKLYLEPQKKKADLIIQNYHDPSKAIEVISDHIRKVLDR